MRFFNKNVKRFFSFLFLFTLLFSTVSFATSKDTKTKNTYVSIESLKNGSPFLHPELGELSREDLLALITYMSSFCGLDRDSNASYNAAFIDSKHNTAKFRKYLRFKGVDDNEEDPYNSLIQNITAIQGDILDSNGQVEEFLHIYLDDQCTQPATVGDLFELMASRGRGGIRYTPNQASYYRLKENLDVVLYAKDKSGGTKTIFNGKSSIYKYFKELIDLQMRQTNSYYTLDSSYPLIRDRFGNICVVDSFKVHYVIIPMALNYNIVSNKSKTKLNLLKFSLLKRFKEVRLGATANSGDLNTSSFETIGEVQLVEKTGWLDASSAASAVINTHNILTKYVDLNSTSANELFSLKDGNWGIMYHATSTDSDGLKNTAQTMYLNYACAAYGLLDDMIIDNPFFDESLINPSILYEKSTKVSDEDFIKSGVKGLLENPVAWIFNTLFKGIFNFIYGFFSNQTVLTEDSNTNLIPQYSLVREAPLLDGFFDFFSSYWVGLVLVLIAFIGYNFGENKEKSGIIYSILIGLVGFSMFFLAETSMNFISGAAEDKIIETFAGQQNAWLLDYNIAFSKFSSDASMDSMNKNLSLTNGDGNSLRVGVEKSPVIIDNPSNTAIGNLLALSSIANTMVASSILRQIRKNNSISTNIEELFKRLVITSFTEYGSANFNVFEDSNTYTNNIRRKSIDGTVSNNSTIVNTNQYYGVRKQNVSSLQKYYPDNKLPLVFIPTIVEMDQNGQTVPSYVFASGFDINDIESVPELNIGTNHTTFYILNDLNVDTTDFDSSPNIDSMKQELRGVYTKYVGNNTVSGGQTNVSELNKFSMTDETSLFDRNYGYFLLTDSVIPYFYQVFADTFADAKTSQQILSQLQGMIKYENYANVYDNKITVMPGADSFVTGTEVPKPVITKVTKGLQEFDLYTRRSALLENSKVKDYLDLRELFLNIIPYCNAVSYVAREEFGTDELIGSDYAIYKNNPKYWVFDANWAVKLQHLYGNQINENTRFSEYDFVLDNSGKDASMFESLIYSFYEELTDNLEDLIDVNNLNQLSKPTLLRQMAVIAGLQFNRTFSTSLMKIQPTRLMVSSVGIDTLLKQVLESSGVGINRKLNAAENYNKTKGSNLVGTLLICITAIGFAFINIIRLICIYGFVVALFLSIFKMVSNTNNTATPFNVCMGTLCSWSLLTVLVYLPLFIMIWFGTFSAMPLFIKLIIMAVVSVCSGTLAAKYTISLVFNAGDMGFTTIKEGITDLSSSLKGLKPGEAVKRGFGKIGNVLKGASIGVGGFTVGRATSMASYRVDKLLTQDLAEGDKGYALQQAVKKKYEIAAALGSKGAQAKLQEVSQYRRKEENLKIQYENRSNIIDIKKDTGHIRNVGDLNYKDTQKIKKTQGEIYSQGKSAANMLNKLDEKVTSANKGID